MGRDLITTRDIAITKGSGPASMRAGSTAACRRGPSTRRVFAVCSSSSGGHSPTAVRAASRKQAAGAGLATTMATAANLVADGIYGSSA